MPKPENVDFLCTETSKPVVFLHTIASKKASLFSVSHSFVKEMLRCCWFTKSKKSEAWFLSLQATNVSSTYLR